MRNALTSFSMVALVGGFGIALAGCALGPDYQQPEASSLQLHDQFYGQQQVTHVDEHGQPVTASIAAERWQSIYNDEQLKQVIDEALANNLDLQSARSNVRAAQAASTIASAGFWPSLGLNHESERERLTDNASGGNTSSFEDSHNLYGLLSWELDLWGVNRRNAEAGRARAQLAEYSLYDLQVSLIANIANTYFDLLDLDNQLAVTRATVDTRREAVRILKLRKANGIISGLDVRQAEVALAEALRTLPQLERNQYAKEIQLNFLMGRAPGTLTRSSELDHRELPETIPVGLPSELLLRRPDLRAAEQAMVAANADAGAAKGQLFPSITLTGEFGFDSSELSNLLSGGSQYWISTAGLTQPIFSAGANIANYDAAKEAYNQSLLAYKSSVLEALGEVSEGLNVYRLSQDQEKATEQLLAAATDYLRLALLQYQNGVLGYIDVLDAQRQQFDAELSLSQARRDRLKAAAFIYKALGGGWEINQ